jgi:hypothetical protein
MESAMWERVNLGRCPLEHGADVMHKGARRRDSLVCLMLWNTEDGRNEAARVRISKLLAQYGALEHWFGRLIPPLKMAKI